MPADAVVRVGRAYGMTANRSIYRAVAVTDNHQLLAARDLDYVPLEQARSIDELVQALRVAAARTPPGQLAGITATSADPPSGTVVRLGDRTPAGVLIEAGALDPVRRLLPPVTEAQQADLLARQCRLYNRRGIGVVRDPGLVPGEVPVYQAVADRGELTTRTRLMFWVLPQATVADTLAYVDSLPVPGSVSGSGSGSDDGGLGIWGLKLGMDGGVEGGFLGQPYANNPGFRGHAFWEPDDFEQVVEHAVGRGWRLGCHAVGDRAVRRVLDAYERVAARHPGLPPGTLVIEHAFLADAQARARAVRLGVGITVQHPLLYSLGGNLVRYWGAERAGQVMPVRAWVDAGALIAAGSDCNVSFFDPPLSIWGLVTRGTRTARVQGPEYRVDTYTAIRLYTEAGGRMLGEDGSVGILAPGAFADIVGFRGDLLDCPVDDLPSQQSALTLVGGRPVHDPDGLLGAA
jgi:predicted amidohydrolase YtcJ